MIQRDDDFGIHKGLCVSPTECRAARKCLGPCESSIPSAVRPTEVLSGCAVRAAIQQEANAAASPLGGFTAVLAEYDRITDLLDARDAEADFVMRGSDWSVIREELDRLLSAPYSWARDNAVASARAPLKWQQRPESYTPSEHGDQIWPEAAPFTIAYFATNSRWYTLDVPVPVLGNATDSPTVTK